MNVEVREVTQHLERVMQKWKELQIDDEYNDCVYMDVCEIKGIIANLEECIENVKTYTSDPSTNYEELWESKKSFAEQVKKSKEAWIRTEIFSFLLNN